MRLSAEVLKSTLEVDLMLAGWDNSFFPGMSHRHAAMNALHSSVIKKFHNETSDRKRDDAALQLFLECNEQCRNFTSVRPARLDEEYCIGEMKTFLYDFFNPMPYKTSLEEAPQREPFLLNGSQIASGFRWGSGSNIGVRSTDFYSKSSCSSMATTNDLLVKYFRRDLSSVSPLWNDVEVFRSERRGYERVRGSRLSFVPKSTDISRTICTEPLLNMLYQQGIAKLLEGRLFEVFGLDFSVQPERNARLARIGSLTGDFGTIDLSSASDTISYSLIKELVPAESFRWLDLTRSPVTILPDGREIELHMISSMGNGYTFPLQTTIFACLVAAAYKLHEIKLTRPGRLTDGNFAVFGDDIIVDHRVYDLVIRCLAILGFTVNRKKSFNEGLFRESCGSDWFSGHNVRGVYISRLLTDGDVYSSINRLNRWSATHGIPLVNTVGYLLRGCRFIGVPYDEADDAGIKVPLALARHARGDMHGTYSYMALCNTPLRVELPLLGCDTGVTLKKKMKRVARYMPDFFYSSDGLLLSLVGGYLRGGSVSLRIERRRASLRRKTCPGWDRFPSATASEQSFGEGWKAFVAINLEKRSIVTSA